MTVKKRFWFLALALVLALSVGSIGFANDHGFVGGIGTLSAEEEVLDWLHNVAPTQGIKLVDGSHQPADSEEVLTFEEAAVLLGAEVAPKSSRNPFFGMVTATVETQERAEVESGQGLIQALASTIKPTINPPTPITSRLVDAIGWYPDDRNLGLLPLVYSDGSFAGYELLIGVNEYDGGPAQARRFELRNFSLLDGTLVNVNMWFTNDYYTTSASTGFTTYWYRSGYFWNPWMMSKVQISYEVWWGKPWAVGQSPESIYAGGAIGIPNENIPQTWGPLFQ